jgi:hypothetical protein
MAAEFAVFLAIQDCAIMATNPYQSPQPGDLAGNTPVAERLAENRSGHGAVAMLWRGALIGGGVAAVVGGFATALLGVAFGLLGAPPDPDSTNPPAGASPGFATGTFGAIYGLILGAGVGTLLGLALALTPRRQASTVRAVFILASATFGG